MSANTSSDTLVAEATRKPFGEFLRRFARQKAAIVALVFLLLLIGSAIFAPLFMTLDPNSADYNAILQGSSAAHWAGTAEDGRDIFTRIIKVRRNSLAVGILSVTLVRLIGVFLGILAGFYGGFLDSLIMRISDVLFAFPGILLAIAVIAILGPGIDNVIYAVAVFSVPVFARLSRGTTLSMKKAVYIDAARAIGVSDHMIVLRHLLPGTLPNVIVYFSMRIGTSILTAASLSFIGLGAQPPSSEWGAMLAAGRSYMGVADHLTLYPGIAIFVTVLAFNVFGDGLRDALDPKIDVN